MILFNQDELEALVETLHDQPGFITAAVVPAGSGGALIERLREELGELEIEVASHQLRPVQLGKRAAELGQTREDGVFIIQLREPESFDGEDEAVQFWRELNFQREVLATGTVRTCLLLSEETEPGFARIADDLWDWATVFRFPEALEASVRTPADSEALLWSALGPRLDPSEDDLAILRSQWRRARQAGLSQAALVEKYAVPLFLALPESCHGEALQLWRSHLLEPEAVDDLSPEVALLVARKMMSLTKAGDLDLAADRDELIQDALEVADGAVAILDARAGDHLEFFGRGLAAAVSVSAKLQQDAGNFEVALEQLEKCLDLLGRIDRVEGEDLLASHHQRRWALVFLLRARESQKLPLLEQVEMLRAMEGPSLEDTDLNDSVRSNALGAALEISLAQLDNPVSEANACLFSAWVLSHDSHLEGPTFEEVLAQDPVSYCRGIEAIWQLAVRVRWEQLLVEPLIREWASEGPACAVVREQLGGGGWSLVSRGCPG